jgi:hypothetical protein
MLKRGIVIIAGVLVYVLVTGIVLSSGGATPSRPRGGAADQDFSGTGATNLEGLPFRSVGIQIQRVDWVDEYKKVMDKVADVGADTVLLAIDARQENGKSSKIYLDYRLTPTTTQLGDLIDYAKKKQLRVILMPMVLLDAPIGSEWRGTIHPESWEDWWESYREMMQVFSSVAEVHHADMLIVGSELVSTEEMRDQWLKVIELCRANFKGKLTYSSNWDHYEVVSFWDKLDMVGMNSYWQLSKEVGSKNVSIEEITGRWRDIQEGLLPFLRKVHKPLIFTEIGWFSQANVAKEPWDYTKPDEPVDLELQKKLYEAFFQSWWGNPMLGGFSIWEWPPNMGGPDDKGYTPEGKPALEVLRAWLKKGRWEVK